MPVGFRIYVSFNSCVSSQQSQLIDNPCDRKSGVTWYSVDQNKQPQKVIRSVGQYRPFIGEWYPIP